MPIGTLIIKLSYAPLEIAVQPGETENILFFKDSPHLESKHPFFQISNGASPYKIIYSIKATASISTSTSLGNRLTSTVALAGGLETKYFP